MRHPSFLAPAFFALLRKHRIAFVFADTAGRWPYAEDLTADFLYLRLHGAEQLYVSGYEAAALIGGPRGSAAGPAAPSVRTTRGGSSCREASARRSPMRILFRQRREGQGAVRCETTREASARIAQAADALYRELALVVLVMLALSAFFLFPDESEKLKARIASAADFRIARGDESSTHP